MFFLKHRPSKKINIVKIRAEFTEKIQIEYFVSLNAVSCKTRAP